MLALRNRPGVLTWSAVPVVVPSEKFGDSARRNSSLDMPSYVVGRGTGVANGEANDFI
jgi:hypothetical protein